MISRLRGIKLSTRIALSFALVLPITAWALGAQSANSWRIYRTAGIADVQNASANALILGVYDILIERQFVNNALRAANPATSDDLKKIKSYRAPATAKIDAAFADLLKQDFSGKASLVAEFNAAREKMNTYRSKADSAVALAAPQRDADTVKNTYAVMSAFVETAQKLWSGVLANTSGLDPELSRLANIRVLAWNMRDTAGRERAAIAQALSAKAVLSPDNLSAIKTIRAQIALMWRLLEGNLKEAEHDGIVKGVEAAESGYFSKFQPLADQMQAVSAAGTDYPMTTAQWAETTTPLLATILDVMKGASQASELYTAEFKRSGWQNVVLSIGLLMTCVILFFGAIAFSVLTVARPLRALTRPLDELANGNFAVVVPGLERKDEIGQIAGAVDAMAGKVRTALAQIKVSAREVTNASLEISTSTTDLSQRTEEQAASLEETTASMEQISSIVRQNSESAQQASQSAAQTRDIADKSGAVVAKAIEAMARIEESSHKVSDIIGVIDEIARQTNLLALNAAVEAARAGEAGRGFAVVATEVRSLAQRSSQAAKDITSLITNSSGQVQEGVELVNRAGSALGEITKSINVVTTIIADIAAASLEQSSGLDEINKAMTQMDNVTQQNSALVEENAATAKMLEAQAQNMDDQVGYFRIDAAEGDEIGGSSARPAIEARPRRQASSAPRLSTAAA
jgi:methyl-accepting chemotaxis protein